MIDLRICKASISGFCYKRLNCCKKCGKYGSILLFVICTAWNTREYRFSLTRILPYKDIITDSALIRGNMGKWKTIFSHSLSSRVFNENICINLEVIYRFYVLIFSWLVNYGIQWFLGFRKPRIKIIMDVLFHWFVEHFWKIFGLVYCQYTAF